MKKIIITITILSFLNLIGCYYQEQMNPSTYDFDENEELQLTTTDTTYTIGAKDYYLENDTLFAILQKKLDRQTTLKTEIEIPIKDIDKIEVERSDTGMTFLTVLGSIVVITGLLFLISAAASGYIEFD